MPEPQNWLFDTYPFGADPRVPIGIDVERYCQDFYEDSRRLFVSHGDRMDIIRVLSGSGGEIILGV